MYHQAPIALTFFLCFTKAFPRNFQGNQGALTLSQDVKQQGAGQPFQMNGGKFSRVLCFNKLHDEQNKHELNNEEKYGT